MELPISQEGDDMPIGPIPLNSTYGGGSHAHGHGHSPHPHPHPHPHSHVHAHGHGHGHIIHHDHTIIPASSAAAAAAPAAPLTITTNNQIPSNGPTISDDDDDDHDINIHHHHHNMAVPAFKKMIRYRECLKNHAASMGGNATDGCGEFMPSGEEGTIEALTCSACNCHRNFHRKEIEGDPQNSCEITNCYHGNVVNPRMPRKLFMGHHHKPGSFMAPAEAIGYHAGLISSRPHQMIMSYNMGGGGGGGGGHPSESDDPEDGGGGGGGMMMRPIQNKKRFRTKFTQEQKEKMLSFAEKVGWKIQKQEEGVVQQFCQEVGVKRRVLKVWMHNNKHNLAKKNNPQSDPQSQSQSQNQV